MARKSRDKGLAGEREVAVVWESHGFAVRGLEGMGDHLAVGHGLTIHSEVKRTESIRLWDCLAQCWDEAPDGTLPVLAYRRNRSPWVASLKLDDLCRALAR